MTEKETYHSEDRKKHSLEYQIDKITEDMKNDKNNNNELNENKEVESSSEFILIVVWFLILTFGFDKFDQGSLPAMMKYSINDHHVDQCSQCMGFGEKWTA